MRATKGTYSKPLRVSYYLENHRGALPDGKPAPLADRLRITRERLQLTQAKASEAADVSQQVTPERSGERASPENRSKLEAWLRQIDASD